MLVDDRDPQLLRDRGREVLDDRPVEDDRAAVGGDRPRGNGHERRFAGAVLSEERVHLARQDLERHIRERRDRSEMLRDLAQRKRRLRSRLGSGGSEAHGWFVAHDESC